MKFYQYLKENPVRLVDTIEPGDIVTIVTRQGSKIKGRAVMRSQHGGWVLNAGGRHGTPALADDSNVINVRRGKSQTNYRPLGEDVEKGVASV